MAPLAGYPTSIRHVVTVVFENENPGTVFQQGPFERYLAEKYAYANSYYSVCHPSAPNYLAITSGMTFQCGSDNYSEYSSANIADLVQQSGQTWGAYMESMPQPCDTGNTNLYAVRHDPFAYYQDIVDNATRCTSHVRNFTSWNASVASGNIPNYAFVSPNVLDDGHNTNVSYADSWLQKWLSPLLNDSFASSTVYFIVYDESSGSNTGYSGLDGGKVFFTAVGPGVRTNFTERANVSHYNLLTTTEWLLGLGHIGGNDTGSQFPPMKSLFTAPSTRSFSLSGDVRAMGSGAEIPGANVSVMGGPSLRSTPNGSYRFLLVNGSYNLTASAPGFVPSSVQVVIDGINDTQNFSLREATHQISGMVVDAVDGLPIPGAAVAVSGRLAGVTNATGAYSIVLAAGTYLLVVTAVGFVTASLPVSVEGTNLTRNFSLDPRPIPEYALAGSVAYGSNGSLARGVTVTVNSTLRATTPENGSFLFEVPNGTYTVSAILAGFLPATAVLQIRGDPMSVDLSLFATTTFVLYGSVRSNATGLPLAGATVHLNTTVVEVTGTNGTFRFQPSGGLYELNVTDPGYGSSHLSVLVDATSPSREVIVYLDPRSAPVDGPRVTYGGLPAPLLLLVLVFLGVGAVLFGLVRSRSRSGRRPPREGSGGGNDRPGPVVAE